MPGRAGLVVRHGGVYAEVERARVWEGVSLPAADGGGVGVRGPRGDDRGAVRRIGLDRVVWR